MKMYLGVVLALGATMAVAVANDGAAVAAAPRPTKLALTEYAYNAYNSPHTSWYELYNGTSQSIDLSTYVLDVSVDARVSAPNLKGKLGPGQFAILYNFTSLISECKTEDGCSSYFTQAWTNTPANTLMVPLANKKSGARFPDLENGTIALWASFADYTADTDPVDLRKTPKKAVFVIPMSDKYRSAWDARPDKNVRPSIYLANPAKPDDPASWKFSVVGTNSAYAATTNPGNSNKHFMLFDVGSPGQL
jgi:hypothetical protein